MKKKSVSKKPKTVKKLELKQLKELSGSSKLTDCAGFKSGDAEFKASHR